MSLDDIADAAVMQAAAAADHKAPELQHASPPPPPPPPPVTACTARSVPGEARHAQPESPAPSPSSSPSPPSLDRDTAHVSRQASNLSDSTGTETDAFESDSNCASLPRSDAPVLPAAPSAMAATSSAARQLQQQHDQHHDQTTAPPVPSEQQHHHHHHHHHHHQVRQHQPHQQQKLHHHHLQQTRKGDALRLSASYDMVSGDHDNPSAKKRRADANVAPNGKAKKNATGSGNSSSATKVSRCSAAANSAAAATAAVSAATTATAAAAVATEGSPAASATAREWFPAEMLLDLAGSTSAEVRRMNDDERALVHYKRRLRNRESAKRSRARRQATISDIQVELEDLRQLTASLVDRCMTFARVNDKQSQELETLRKEKHLLESMLRSSGSSVL